MFSNFEEIEKEVNREDVPAVRRWLYYAAVFAVSAVIFGSLYMGIRFLE